MGRHFCCYPKSILCTKWHTKPEPATVAAALILNCIKMTFFTMHQAKAHLGFQSESCRITVLTEGRSVPPPSTYHKHLPRDASAASFSGNGAAQPPSQLNHRCGTAGSERLCTVMLPMAMQRAKLQTTSDIKDVAVTGAVHYSSTKNKQAYCCRQAQQLTVSELLSKVIVPTDILTNK